jgi:hypothetical protein
MLKIANRFNVGLGAVQISCRTHHFARTISDAPDNDSTEAKRFKDEKRERRLRIG